MGSMSGFLASREFVVKCLLLYHSDSSYKLPSRKEKAKSQQGKTSQIEIFTRKWKELRDSSVMSLSV
jgi:hypothetical protein